MRFVRVAAIVASGAAPFGAQAADMSVPVTPLDTAIANSAHDWAGAYVGVNAGYAWGDFSTAGLLTANNPSFDGNGPLGGFQIGYNKQLGSVVIGVEADIQGAAADGSSSGGGTTSATSLDWFSTARGRVGYAFDNTLVYGTAGFAVTGVEVSTSGAGTDDKILTGFTAGAGLEQALTDNISLKAEYLYVDTQKKTFDTGAGNTQAEWDGHVLRFGANLKF